MLTPVKNNEFQVTTTNQFSYLPYQQHLLNYNNNNNTAKLQPFARTSKLRQNFGKKSGNRPKSVDFEVLKSVENICRAQPIVYGPSLLEVGGGGLDFSQLRASQREGGGGGIDFSQLRASQRERIKDRIGEWQSVHATRV